MPAASQHSLCGRLSAIVLLARVGSSPRTAKRRPGTSSRTSPAGSPADSRPRSARWEVVRDGENQVLAQKASNPDETFNVALATDTHFKDLDISVRLKAVAGELDRGGGLVWRARDKDNYYIARYNPLEDNFRVYKVEKGQRTQFASAKVPGDTNWHTLRVTMAGRHITCYLDGKKHLEADDATFPDAGRIGLWSKADARSYFDDLVVDGE